MNTGTRIESKRATVLVVDDDPDLREAIVDIVVGAGWNVLEAFDSDSCLAVVASDRPQVVVLDHRIPGRTGAEIYGDLRRAGDAPSVILVSAARDIAAIAASVGVDRVLKKPFDADELIATIDEALEQGGPRHSEEMP